MQPDRREAVPSLHSRFSGCLLAGAIGDALGAPIEFMLRSEIERRFGLDGIRDFAPAYGGIGRITDDTQMTLFTAEGLLRAWVRGRSKGITSYPAVTAASYLRWLETQGEKAAVELPGRHDRGQIGHNRGQIRYDDGQIRHDGWLIGHRELHDRRAPGNTCLSALREMHVLGDPARNDSKGCGGAMRVAPVGLFASRFDASSPQQTFRLACELAALTHGHPTGVLASGAFAVLVESVTKGATLHEALATAKTCLRNEERHEETLEALEQAERLAASDVPSHEAINVLGRGWVAEEALAISVYCALVARDLEDGLILAVNHDGDSDSIGSMTGNLLGAMHGVEAIPRQWLEPLELRNVIEEVAEDLYSFKDWPIGEYASDDAEARRILEKYPGW